MKLLHAAIAVLIVLLLLPASALAGGKSPRASFAVSANPTVNTSTTFNAAASTCYAAATRTWANAACASYAWADDLDDADPLDAPSQLGTGRVLARTFGLANTKYVWLTVTDTAGRTTATMQPVTVASGPTPTPTPTPAPTITPTPTPTPTGCIVAQPVTTWRAPGAAPLTDAQAAACVRRSGENRTQNTQQNAKCPTAAELDAFRTAKDSAGRTPSAYNANFGKVTGGAACQGLRSTDDMLEWAAYKWGVPEDLVRGQAVMESGWSMLQQGDRHDWAEPVSHLYPARAVIDADSVWESLGIMQIRWRHSLPWNPGVEPLRWQSTGFATDYGQALIRYYFDGRCDWCGAGYRAGDADGAYRTYVSGSWAEGQWYADGVRSNAASKPWLPVPPPPA